MIKLKRDWGNEKVYPLAVLVKMREFPIDRSIRTVQAWAKSGVRSARGSRVQFPALPMGGGYHSSLEAAREFLAFLGRRSARSVPSLAKAEKSRQRG